MSPEFETENPVTLLVPADVTEAVQLYTVPGVSEVSVKVAVPPAHITCSIFPDSAVALVMLGSRLMVTVNWSVTTVQLVLGSAEASSKTKVSFKSPKTGS